MKTASWLFRLPLFAITHLALCYASTKQPPDITPTARAAYSERTFTFDGTPFAYRVLSPASIRPGERYPLLFFLHGAGERGSDNQSSLRYLPDQMARAPYRDSFPAFVIVPQCREGERWVEAHWGDAKSSRMRPQPSRMMAMAMALLDQSLRDLPIDRDRVYLAGLSMGGYGAWELAARRPETFAAVIPICGGGDEQTAQLLPNVAIWAWHGAADPVVPVDRTRRMIQAIRDAGGSPRFTELPEVEHDSFLRAFAPESGVLRWLFQRHRGPTRSDVPRAGRLRILCAGDSNTEAKEFPGYRAYLKHELDGRGVPIDFVGSKQGGEPRSDPEHEGYSGDGIARIRQRVRDEMIEQFSPDVVLLLVGSDDLWKDAHADASAIPDVRARELGDEVIALVNEIEHRRPRTRVLVGIPATPSSVPGALETYRACLKSGVARLQKQGKHVAAVDMQGLANDGVHYLNDGFRGMAVRWADAMRLRRGNGRPMASALLPGDVRISGPRAPITVFDVVELTIAVKKPTVLNPFTDATVECEFQDPAGVTHHAQGFADAEDGTRFLVRIMPQMPGHYQWRATYDQDTFQTAADGSFDAVKGELHGLVRIDPEYPAHFLYESSHEHFFWNSTTTYALAGWRDEAIIRESLDRLASYKINRARVAITLPRVRSGDQWKEPAIVNDGWFSFCANPWPAERPDDVDDPGFNPHRFNVAYWQKYERLLRYARDRGIQISVIFYVDGRLPGVDPFREPAQGGDLEQLYYRYAVARLSAFSNVMWDITNEYRLFRDDKWAAKMGSLIRQSDPYSHLMSIHGHGDFRFRTAPWIDFAMYQSWDEHGGYKFMLSNREQQAATDRVIPQVNEEYGYEDHYPSPWGEARVWPARTAETRVHNAWQIAMAGGYQTTGERANVPGYGGWINGRGSSEMRMLDEYRIFWEFWTAREWWRMQPIQKVAPDGIPALGISGEEYIFAVNGGSPLALHLPSEGFIASWFDPRTGKSTDAGVAHASDWTSPSTPDGQEWILVLKKNPKPATTPQTN